MKVFSFTGLLFFPFIPLELDQRDTEPKVASWANFENPTSSYEWMFLVGWFSNRMDEEGSNKSGGWRKGILRQCWMIPSPQALGFLELAVPSKNTLNILNIRN